MTLNSVDEYRIRELERRIQVIEATKPEVVAAKLGDLADELKGLRRAFYAFALSVVGSAIIFALSVAFLHK